ncbi:MAG: efflux transporter outer membrane subunit [Myxococcota bacterium]
MRGYRHAVWPVLLLLVSCAIGPDYKRPVVEIPEVYRGSLQAEEAASLADLSWWEIFEDPVLVELIETGLQNNLELEIAVDRTEQAYRQVVATRSSFYPQATYQGDAQRGRTSGVDLGEGTSRSYDFTRYYGAFNVAWEIDIWGRIRRASQAARAELLASEDFQRGVLLSLVSDVASLYLLLLELDASHRIATDAVEAFQHTLLLFTRKFEGGVGNKLEVSRAAAAEAQAAAWIPEIESQIAFVENQLSVILGRPPGKIPRGAALLAQHLPEIPPGLPSELLERRPDVRQAEQGVISANAQIGVAMGNFLPRIGLVAMWGGASENLGDLANGSTSLWNLAGELSGPIFKGGLLYSQYKAQVALWEASRANYELAALTAFGEVSSVLVERRMLREERIARQRQVDQLTQSVTLSLLRYEQGFASYFEVLQAQQELFPAEFDLSEIRLEELLAVIKLYRALGGGWQLGLNWMPEPTPDPSVSPPEGAPSS